MTNLQDLIIINDESATADDCDQLIKWFIDNPEDMQHDMVVKYGDNVPDPSQKKFKQLKLPCGCPPDATMYELISKDLVNYFEKCPILPNAVQLESKDYSLRVYEQGVGFFKQHVDNSLSQGEPEIGSRIFAWILYLNDVESGGETEFPFLDVKVKPKKGRSLMFPCNYMYEHKGNIPITSPKYAATSFIYVV